MKDTEDLYPDDHELRSGRPSIEQPTAPTGTHTDHTAPDPDQGLVELALEPSPETADLT